MLRIHVPESHKEYFDSRSQEFIYVDVKPQTLVLEHSLISISKWEAKWKKPFLDQNAKRTQEETLDYIKCMTINQNVDPNVYLVLTDKNYKQIQEYIEDPMTATTFSRNGPKTSGKKEILTSEVIYYMMIAQQIPADFDKWHINRLLTLIKVCAIKNNPKQKKMSKGAIMRQNASLNKARRAKNHSKG